MTQQGGWGPQGGYPPQQGQGGYPPQGQGGYPPQQPPPGYPPQPGAYNPQGTFAPQGGYPPQGPPGGYGQLPPGGGYGQPGGGMPPQGGPGGYPPAGGQPAKKSAGLIIGIVVAALVLLAAVGGIIMVLNRDPQGQPGPVSITPTEPAPPSAQPTATNQPTPNPPGTPSPDSSGGPGPTPSGTGSQPPAGDAIDLGSGISLTPASGWETQKTGKGVAQLSDGKSVFLGQVIDAEKSTNPGQLCDAWHRKIAEGTSNGKFQDAKSVDLGSKKLSAGTCLAQITVSNGQGSSTVLLFSLVSVRTGDGVTVIGTASFPENADPEQLNKDFSTMTNSMLEDQAKG